MDLYWGHIQQVITGGSPPVLPTIIYGTLYNWYTATDVNFPPTGWHLSTALEGSALMQYLDPAYTSFSINLAGGQMKATGFTYWTSPNTGATNLSGFDGRGGGIRDSGTGTFLSMLQILRIWTPSSTIDTATVKTVSSLSNSNEAFTTLLMGSGRSTAHPRAGCSVRFIKDDSVWTAGDTVTDYDGNIYPTIKIGTQVWTALNWSCTHLNNGTLIPEVTANATWAAMNSGARCYYNNNIANI